MQTEREEEYKFLLTKTSYEEILEQASKFGSPNTKIQVNYYFDTPNLSLFLLDNTLRLRTSENDYILTLKNKIIKGKLAIATEKSVSLNKTDAANLLVHYTWPVEFTELLRLTEVDIREILLLGSLSTIRKDILIDGLTISLDKNIFLGHIDYELEVEIDTAEEKITNKLLDTLEFINLSNSSSDKGKYTRFINRFKEHS